VTREFLFLFFITVSSVLSLVLASNVKKILVSIHYLVFGFLYFSFKLFFKSGNMTYVFVFTVIYLIVMTYLLMGSRLLRNK
jgi:hypothetical protein